MIAAACALSSCKDETVTPSGNGDVTLAPPPTGQGFQVVLDTFAVPVGEEVQKNFYLKLPNTEDVYVTKIEFRYNKGSHHLNIFKNDTADVPDHVEDTFNAIQFESWDLVAGSQTNAFDWQMPAGVAIKFKAHQQMDFQTHFVNAGTQSTPTGRGKVIVNFWTTPKSNVTSLVGAVFVNDKQLNIQPHTAITYCKVIKPFDHDVNVLLLTGHYHSRGKNFVIGHWDGANRRLIDTIYSNKTWDEPPVLQFATPYVVKAGDSLAMVTSFENRSDNIITFGPHVEKEEHANAFIFYYPGPDNGKAIYDFTKIEMIMEQHPI
jgi:hypothetical protein